jgi:hypothetical protein
MKNKVDGGFKIEQIVGGEGSVKGVWEVCDGPFGERTHQQSAEK